MNFKLRIAETFGDNPFKVRIGSGSDEIFFEYDSTTEKPLEAGKWYAVKIEKKENGQFEKTIEEIPEEPKPIGPMFLCPLHDVEQFESGPCPDCYDEYYCHES